MLKDFVISTLRSTSVISVEFGWMCEEISLALEDTPKEIRAAKSAARMRKIFETITEKKQQEIKEEIYDVKVEVVN